MNTGEFYSHRERIKGKIKSANETHVSSDQAKDLLILSEMLDASFKGFTKILEINSSPQTKEIVIETLKIMSEMDKI